MFSTFDLIKVMILFICGFETNMEVIRVDIIIVVVMSVSFIIIGHSAL